MSDEQIDSLVRMAIEDLRSREGRAWSRRNDTNIPPLSESDKAELLAEFQRLHPSVETKTRAKPQPTRSSWVDSLSFARPRFATPAFAVALLLLAAVPATLFISGVLGGRPIVLATAGGKSAGADVESKLELKLSAGKVRLTFNQVSLSGSLASQPSQASDQEIFQLEAAGKDAQGQPVTVKGVLRIIRADERKPIRTAVDIASGRFAGTIETTGKPVEAVTWIYQPQR